MTFDDIKDMRIGSKKVLSAWLDGKQIYPGAKRILDSLILWVDPKKQQATNESMAKNPKLTDLSGNGHDIDLFNFSWSGMSGIGGYNLDASLISPNDSSKINMEVSGSTVTYSRVDSTLNITVGSPLLYVNISNNDLPVNGEYGIKAGEYGVIVLQTEPANTANITLLSLQPYETGKFTINQEELDNGKMKLMFGNTVEIPAGGSGSFEILPKYPNALVSDGVDDYAQVTGLPLLNKERGYTVIAKRDYVDLEGFVHNSVFIDKTGLKIETYLHKETAKFNTYSFGGRTVLDGFTNELVVQTSKKYGQTDISMGTLADDSILDIFKNIGGTWNGRIALYSLLLFDRDLTDAEIGWVKENMVEADGVMMYDWMDRDLFNEWIEDGTRAIGSINSNKIVITGIVSPYARFFETVGSDEKLVNSYKVKVTGVTDNVHILYSGQANSIETTFLEISQDGIYTLPQVEGRAVGFKPFFVDGNTDAPVNITIQQLLTPLDQPFDSSLVDAWIFSGHTNDEAPYQIAGEKGINLICYNFAWNEQGSGFKDGALHFDGVDDNLSCLNIYGEIPELDDYTVICRRYVTPGKNSCTASKDPASNHNGAFIFELKEGTDIKTYSFKVGTSIDDFAGKESVSWQTKNSYNGLELVSSSSSDTDDFRIGWRGPISNTFFDGYIKYFALYDRTLSVNEIQAEIRKLEYKWEKRLNNK